MRKLLLTGLAGVILAGGVMAPALADQRPDYDQRYDRHDDRRDDRRDDWRDDRHDGRRDDRRYDNRGGHDRDYRYDSSWNGARYRGPAYAYPRGYGYQSWGVGYRLPQAYFGNRYWIGNPGYYRLPPAYRGTRWVRVGPDALLIDRRSGYVVRAVRGLYW